MPGRIDTSSPQSKVHDIAQDPISVPSWLFLTGAIIHMTVTFLSCMMEINWLHDEIQLVHPESHDGD